MAEQRDQPGTADRSGGGSVSEDDNDIWSDGRTAKEWRDAMPDPALTAHERGNPIELAAIEAGFCGMHNYGAYDGTYYDPASFVMVFPGDGSDEWSIQWVGDAIDTVGESMKSMRRFCAAFLKVTSDSPTSASNTTIVVKRGDL